MSKFSNKAQAAAAGLLAIVLFGGLLAGCSNGGRQADKPGNPAGKSAAGPKTSPAAGGQRTANPARIVTTLAAGQAMRAVEFSKMPRESRYLYRLPYRSGLASTIGQGEDSFPTHSGGMRYALDFAFEEGTPLLAAREGVVETVEMRYTKSGLTDYYRSRGNRVDIRHSDGTIATYYHLKHSAPYVKVGQRVKAGQLIGLCGKTGFSPGPHLHFQVDKLIDGKRQSIPVVFHSPQGGPMRLSEGIMYKAPSYDAKGNVIVRRTSVPAGMGDLAGLRVTLINLVGSEPDLKKASALFTSYLTKNEKRLHREWVDLNSKAMAGDRKAQAELVFIMNLEDLSREPELSRVLDPKNPYVALTEPGMMIWWQLYTPDK